MLAVNNTRRQGFCHSKINIQIDATAPGQQMIWRKKRVVNAVTDNDLNVHSPIQTTKSTPLNNHNHSLINLRFLKLRGRYTLLLLQRSWCLGYCLGYDQRASYVRSFLIVFFELQIHSHWLDNFIGQCLSSGPLKRQRAWFVTVCCRESWYPGLTLPTI